jgi:flagellin-like hook-associated protein FlgL
MSSIPANLSRVPNLLASQLLLSTISRTNVDLLTVQTQLASGKRITRFSDDAIAAGTVSLLQQRLAQGSQILDNLSAAQNSLNSLDSNIGEATNVVRSAKDIASSQIGVQSDQITRDRESVTVDGMLASLLQIANRATNGLYGFGGSTATVPPIQELHGGYRYVGRGTGLRANLGPAADVPITIGGDNAIGETSARLKGTADLNPSLTGGTRIGDLGGARAQGISKGVIQFSFNGGPTATVDLSNVDTAADVQAALTSAIHQYETANSVTVLGPGGVSFNGGALKIDVAAGGSLAFSDIGTGQVAADFGLSQAAFSPANATGADLNPKLNLLTPVSALSGVTVPLGTIRFRFSTPTGSQITNVDLSSAQTVDDIRNLIETQVPGVRVQINDAGNGIDLYNEIAGPALSVEPTGTGPNTASELGIRSLDLSTKTADYNDGRGVQIVDNQADPVTGVVTRALNTDFRITLGNGQAFDVDLRPQDLADTQSILARINSEFATAVGQPPVNSSAPALTASDFTAALATNGNGIALTQNLSGTPSAITVAKLNDSGAAEDLGLLSGTYDSTSATFTAQDPAAIHVQNIFTSLVQLRDALKADDSNGITLAGSGLDAQINRLAQAQALVGVYANRVKDAVSTQTDENTTNEALRSQYQDTDFTEAATRYSNLRTQLQAALQTGADVQSLSLLDFIKGL